MAQLVIKPGLSMPVGAAARRLQQHGNELVATSIAAIGRIRRRLLESGQQSPPREPAYFEAARMSREMYRL